MRLLDDLKKKDDSANLEKTHWIALCGSLWKRLWTVIRQPMQ